MGHQVDIKNTSKKMGEIHKKVLSLLYTENEDSFEMTSQHTGVYVSKTTLVLTCVVGFL